MRSGHKDVGEPGLVTHSKHNGDTLSHQINVSMEFVVILKITVLAFLLFGVQQNVSILGIMNKFVLWNVVIPRLHRMKQFSYAARPKIFSQVSTGLYRLAPSHSVS